MSSKKNTYLIATFCFVLAIVIFSACKKESNENNPYDNVNYGTGNGNEPTLDPTSIEGIHQQILIVKCANPGCHDGTFEPDFRTVQSSYSTLVYQGVNKVTVDSLNYFDYRVIPFDATNSFLMERLTTSTFDYMPSNAVRLSQKEINNVEEWINKGAPDLFGNINSLPSIPNQQPIVSVFAAYHNGVQIDTDRLNNVFYNPFLVSDTITMDLAFFLNDDSTASAQLINSLVKISTDPDDFTNAQVFTPIFFPYTGGLWLASIPTNLFALNTTQYIRYYTNDGDHVDDMEYPNNSTPAYLKSYYSFRVLQ